MPYRRLLVLVEGQDDKDFFEHVICPRLQNVLYDDIQVHTHAKKNNNYVKGLIASFTSMGADYCFIHDMDGAPCVTTRKEILKEHHPFIQSDKTLIVTEEIESWYAAGLTPDAAATLRVKHLQTTERLTKEEFERWLPPSCLSRKVFMMELLQHFSLEEAANKNPSFRYCLAKLGIQLPESP